MISSRPSWRHPIKRLRWFRRHGRTKHVVSYSIPGDSARIEAAVRRFSEQLDEFGRTR